MEILGGKEREETGRRRGEDDRVIEGEVKGEEEMGECEGEG